MASSTISRNHKLLSLTKTLTSQSFIKTTPFPSFRAAKFAIVKESDPEKLADLFQQSAHLPTFRRHRPIFHLSVRKLARSNRLDLVERLLQSQLATCPSNSEGFWIRILMLYSSAGMLDRALETLNHYKNENAFELTEKSLCAILSAYLNNGCYEKVRELFDTMPEKLDVKPGVVSNNLVLKSFVKQDKVELAGDWIVKMESDYGVAPNIDSYNVLLGGHLKNKDFKGFDGVVKEVLNKGLECNMTTYNFRITRFVNQKESVRAKKLLDEMLVKGVKPNSASYNTVIDGFCRVGDFDSAKEVLKGMLKDGHVKPCSFTYYTMIRSMVKEGEIDLALGVFRKIIRGKWVPPFEATEGLVRGLVNLSREEEAKKVVKKMKKRLKGEAAESWGKIEAAIPLWMSNFIATNGQSNV